MRIILKNRSHDTLIKQFSNKEDLIEYINNHEFNFNEYLTYCKLCNIKPCYYSSLLEFKDFIYYISII